MPIKIKFLRPLALIVIFNSSSGWACDSILKAKAKAEGRSSSFSKDC